VTLRILFIDDNPDDAQLAVLALRGAGETLVHELVGTIDALPAALERGPWDAVISDYNLGAGTALDVLRIVRARERGLPCIIVSGTIGDERVAEAIRQGASDYVSKNDLSRLALVVRRELETVAARERQHELEARLNEIRERYRKTFEQAPIGIAHGDRDARLITINDNYARLLGCGAQELIGQRWLDYVDPLPGDPALTLTQYQEFFDTSRGVARYERRYRRKDGSHAWANLTLSVMRDANDRPEYVIAVAEDITAQKRTNEQLLVQARLLECVEQATIATDLQGRVTYWNRVAEQMYGWSTEEAMGRSILELTPAPETNAEATEIMERLSRGESWRGELLLTRRDGTTFPALIVDSPLFDDRGMLAGIVGVSHDLTEQKRTENRLRAHQLQLDAAQEIARVGSWTYDLATREREWSDGLWRLYGLAPGTHDSFEPLFALLHPDDRDRMIELQQRAYETATPFHAEFRTLRGGEVRTMLTRVHYIHDDEGRPSKILGVVQDITEEKQKEEELRRRAIQQSTVANLGQIALTGASIDFLLEQAASAVQVVLDADLSDIVRKDDDFLLVAGKGWAPGEIGTRTIRAGSQSQTELTITSGHPVVMTNVATETRFVLSELFASKQIASGIMVPILSADGTPWGVLGAHARKPRTYPPYDVEFLRSIATVIGQAIDRSRADAELRTRARQQSAIARLGQVILNSFEDDLFDQACALLMSGTNADYAFYGELTPADKLRFRAGHAWDALPDEIPISESAQAGYTILHGEPVVVEDYADEQRFNTYSRTVPHGIRSGAMVPVTSAMRTFGVLSAQSTKAGHFHEEDIDFMQSVANMLAEAIEREAARRAVEESEHRYRRIFSGATEIIFTIDANGHFISLNDAFETITGWTRDEWLGQPFIEIVSPDDRQRVYALFEQILENSCSLSAEMTLLGKERNINIEVTSFPQTGAGAVVEVYGFARDVTETRRATQERERVTRNLQLLLESTIDGIITLDREGRCTMINRAGAAYLQYRPDELHGTKLHDVAHHGTKEDECSIMRVLETGEARSVTSDSFVRRDGTPLPVAYSAAPIVDEGHSVGVVVTFTDLTERRRLEARLEQANRLSSLGRLAATVAHEFNNVLMGIAPFVEVVRRAPSPEKVSVSLDHIASSVKRGRRISQDILRFTQPAEPVRGRVELQSWLHSVSVEARSLLTRLYDVRLDVEPLSVDGDANQLHQIVMNLILNARDAMSGGGTIHIAVRREPRDARFAFGVIREPHRYAHILVRDEGCGMSEETLRHAFEPLFTTKKNGTGLGLAVTHQVVLRHGGEIFIESTPGEGTTFHVFLPLSEEPEPLAISDAAAEPPPERAARSILLVEDDESVAAGLLALLEFEGFKVTLAKTGAQALTRVKTSSYDAVLLDVGLPDMDGQSVYAGIASTHPQMPVIFSTGHADRGQLEELLVRPHVSFLLKPYEADSLMDAIASVLAA
jgi:PAS domain S-box-containing protein